MARPPRGIALPVVILLLLSLTALGHGALLLARSGLWASRASADDLQARLAAESGVREGMEVLAARPTAMSGLAVGDRVLLSAATPGPGSGFRVEARRLGPELLLLEGAGWREGAPTRRRVGRVVWLLDPLSRVGAAGGVVEYGGELHAAAPLGSLVVIPTDLHQDDPKGSCAGFREEIDSLLSLHPPAPAVQAVSGSSAPWHSGPVDSGVLPGLGLWEGDAIMRRARPLAAGAVSPVAATRGGRCLREEPTNWGSPSDPGGPCGSYRPLLGVEGSLSMVGGEGQGILIVEGDLHLTSGAYFSGIVLVSGRLHLSSGAHIRGFARVGGSVNLLDPVRVEFSPCGALLALRANRELAGVVSLPSGSWILPF